METKSIGKFIATLRKEKSWTQFELAEKLSVSNKTISNWENEVSYPDLSLIPVIADLFNITTDELLRGEKLSFDTKKEDVDRLKYRLSKDLKNKYLISIYISIAIFICFLILFFVGCIVLKQNHNAHVEKDIAGIVLIIIGILFYIFGLFYSIINSKNFISKLDIEEEIASLYFFHLRMKLLIQCLYGLLILSPIFIYLHNKELLNDHKYNVSEELKAKIIYNGKLKMKLGIIFISISLILYVLILCCDMMPIKYFEMKKYGDNILSEEGKYEVLVEGDTFSIKSLSELYSITVLSADIKEGLEVESKIYYFKSFFENKNELEKFVYENDYHYLLGSFEMEFEKNLEKIFIKYDSVVILVLLQNQYKDKIVYTHEKLNLVDVGNHQFKNITSHTYYVRDIVMGFLSFSLVIEVILGLSIYFYKKKYLMYCK